jgi:hypothetical protein
MAAKVKLLIWSLSLVLLCTGVCAFLVFSSENKKAYEITINFFKQNQSAIKNQNYLAVIDYTKPSFVKRLFIYDVHKGAAVMYLVAHGKDSGFIFAGDFSNEVHSHKSCKGFLITGEVFKGEHGRSLQLYGLQDGLNNNAFTRGIVIHGADYVSWISLLANCGRLGRSLGCPSVSQDSIDDVIDKLKDGALVYIHAY